MNEKITIRVAEPEDAEGLLAIYAPYVEKTAVSFEYEVPTTEEFAGRIRNTLEKYPYFVAETDGEIVGYAYAGDFHTRAAFRRCVETSIYIRENVRGMGIGEALYTKLEHALKAMGILNMNASIASTTTEDEYLTNASERFHERMGFVKTAEFHKCGYKFGRWYNLIWMEKMIGEHTENPMPVKICKSMICRINRENTYIKK